MKISIRQVKLKDRQPVMKSPEIKSILVVFFATFVLPVASCKIGPDYSRPETSLPPEWSESNSASGALEKRWWVRYNDPLLTEFIEKSLKNNLDLAASVERIEQAHALVDVISAGLFPSINVYGQDARYLRSRELPSGISTTPPQQRVDIPHSGGNYPGGATVNNLRGLLGLSWDLDIWGRTRRAMEAGGARAQAVELESEILRLALTTEVARIFFSIQAADREIEILNRALSLRTENLRMVSLRFESGVANELEVSQAKAELESTRVDAVGLKSRRAELVHALAEFTGEYPENFHVDSFHAIADAPSIPAGLPSDLIRRRPDILEAENFMIAANANVGLAKANFLPSFSLVGYAGNESERLRGLLRGDSAVWGASTGISFPLLDWGRNSALLNASESAFRESKIVYAKRILGALHQVEDALSQIAVLKEESEAIQKALTASRATFRLADLRYREGLSSYLEVLDAERSLLSNERDDLKNRSDRLTASLAMIRALGGGWEEETMPPSNSN